MKTSTLNCKEETCLLNAVYAALTALRSPFAPAESSLHEQVGSCLAQAGIAFRHEAVLGTGCRADYLAGSIVIEIKRGRPAIKALEAQLARYAACEGVSALILVCEKNVNLSDSINGKPLRVLVLNHLWGVALP